MIKKNVLLVDAVLFLIAIIWAVNFSAVKFAIQEIPPYAFNALRFLGSSIIMMIYFHFYIKDYAFIKKNFKRLLILSMFGTAFLQFLFITGMNWTSASNASLMYATVPIFVALISTVFNLEKVRKITWLGIALSFFGIFIVLSSSGEGVGFSKSTLSGDFMILITAICWSIFTIKAKPLIEESSMATVITVTFALGTLFLIPLAWTELTTMDWVSVSAKSWWMLGFSLFFANVVGYLGWFYGVKIVGNVQTAIFQNMIPIIAVITASVFLGEVIKGSQLWGGLGIVGGVTLTRLSMIFNKPESSTKKTISKSNHVKSIDQINPIDPIEEA